MILVVTLDTEADNQWNHGVPLTLKNLGALEAFQAFCVAQGVRPTYLITSEVAAHESTSQFLRDSLASGNAEVGAHLHPWTTEPFLDEPGLRFNDPVHLMPSQLPTALLRDKLRRLTAQIELSVGCAPVSFRAGRFGFSAACAEELLNLDYVVDSSITPGISWEGSDPAAERAGRPDYRSYDSAAFNIAGQGGKTLYELPVTILPRLGFRGFASWVVRRAARRPGTGLTWCRPLPQYSARDLCRLWDEARRQDLPAVVMMFHSSELAPGCSPYRSTQANVSDLYSVLQEFFGHVRISGGQSCTLTEAARETQAAGIAPIRGWTS